MACKPSRTIAFAALALVLGASGSNAQSPAAASPAPAAPAVVAFTAPDGSRCVLVPDARVPMVHWAVATFVGADDEPRGLEGLACTTARVSLGGTWPTGSANAAQERQALANLDDAWQQAAQMPGDPAVDPIVVRATEIAAGLGDSASFRRVLAALPAHRPEVVVREPVCMLVLTTVPGAIGEVARLLVERRDQQALRELQTAWREDRAQRLASHLADLAAPLHAEVLALAMPTHPAVRSLERPQPVMPSRAQAMAVWESTQRPDRTVHVLLGGFDAAAAAATLTAVFAVAPATRYEPPAIPVLRPFQSTRRSTVHGVKVPAVALAWVLPPIDDRFVLEAAVRWLGDGLDSRIGQDLVRAGRSKASVQCHAPWPRTREGASLLLLEVTDPQATEPASTGQLGDLVLGAVGAAVAAAPTEESLRQVVATLQRRWCGLTDDPRELTLELAEAAVMWPRQAPSPRMPEQLLPDAVQALLAKTFAGQPVVVEGRP